ncbi:uncharacterized protein LOC125325369 isoform X1 [Corvus hawaiiensis]|uniref:uncharacterized protein LOC125325369 isoform X1 n=1 Tax=Corvus hawaiiensis TaxID=134902 RepID=UPI00201A0D5F|nr:uncharacterized protein LOC125325369 isoform X1 [Corvus hawaiiensis]
MNHYSLYCLPFKLYLLPGMRRWNGDYGQYHTLFLPLLLPQGEESLPFSCMVFLPQETVLHELLQCGSFPWAAAFQELLQHRSPSMGYSPSGTGCSSVGPPQGHKSCQKTCSSMASSLQGSTCPFQEPDPVHASHRVTDFFCSSTCSSMGLLYGLQVELCTLMDLQGCRPQLPHHGLHHRLQGNLSSSTWSTSCPSTGFGVCRVVPLTYSHSSLFWPQLHLHNNLGLGFFSLLKHVIQKMLPTVTDWLGLGQWWVIL